MKKNMLLGFLLITLLSVFSVVPTYAGTSDNLITDGGGNVVERIDEGEWTTADSWKHYEDASGLYYGYGVDFMSHVVLSFPPVIPTNTFWITNQNIDISMYEDLINDGQITYQLQGDIRLGDFSSIPPLYLSFIPACVSSYRVNSDSGSQGISASMDDVMLLEGAVTSTSLEVSLGSGINPALYKDVKLILRDDVAPSLVSIKRTTIYGDEIATPNVVASMGEDVYFTVTFDEKVEVLPNLAGSAFDETPTLVLDYPGKPVAKYEGGSGTNELLFKYKIETEFPITECSILSLDKYAKIQDVFHPDGGFGNAYVSLVSETNPYDVAGVFIGAEGIAEISDSQISTVEDMTYDFVAEDFTNQSVHEIKSITIESLPDPMVGTLQYDGIDGVRSIEVGSVIYKDPLVFLDFVPAPGAFGDTSFTWSAEYVYGERSNTAMMSVAVAEDIVAPVINDWSIELRDYEPLMFDQSYFIDNYIEDENPLTEIRILSIPDPDIGLLFLDGDVVEVDDIIGVDQLDALEFLPEDGVIGDGIFTYEAFSGRLWSETSAAVTILVCPRDIEYIALGDSISTGYAINSSNPLMPLHNEAFVDKFAEYEGFNYLNMAEDGAKLADLLEVLENLSEAEKLLFSEAEVVTVSIGGNNLLKPLIQDNDGPGPDMAIRGLDDVETLYNSGRIGIKIALMNAGLSEFDSDIPRFKALMDELCQNTRVQYQAIYNPLDEIIGSGIYNAAIQEEPILEIVFSMIYQQIDARIQMLNSVFMGIEVEQANSSYIDLYNRFKANPIPLTRMMIFDIHPSDAGHEAIARLNQLSHNGAYPFDINVNTSGGETTIVTDLQTGDLLLQVIPDKFHELPDTFIVTINGQEYILDITTMPQMDPLLPLLFYNGLIPAHLITGDVTIDVACEDYYCHGELFIDHNGGFDMVQGQVDLYIVGLVDGKHTVKIVRNKAVTNSMIDINSNLFVETDLYIYLRNDENRYSDIIDLDDLLLSDLVDIYFEEVFATTSLGSNCLSGGSGFIGMKLHEDPMLHNGMLPIMPGVFVLMEHPVGSDGSTFDAFNLSPMTFGLAVGLASNQYQPGLELRGLMINPFNGDIAYSDPFISNILYDIPPVLECNNFIDVTLPGVGGNPPPANVEASLQSLSSLVVLTEEEEAGLEKPSNPYVVKPEFIAKNTNEEEEDETSVSGGSVNSGSGSRPIGNVAVILPDEEIAIEAPGFITPINFLDVSGWYSEYVYYLANLSIMKGVGNDLFNPKGSITRGEVVQVLANMSSADLTNIEASGFDDVKASKWYGPAVAWAEDAGVALGENNKFSPEDLVSRQDLIVMIDRYVKLVAKKDIAIGMDVDKENEEIMEYVDVSMIYSYALESVRLMTANKVVAGTPNSEFQPRAYATRAETAKIIAEVYKLID